MTSLPDSVQAFFLAANVIFSTIVLWTCVCTLNYMTPSTPPVHRLAYVLLGVGAASMLLGPLYFEFKPTVGGTVLAAGTALLLITERLYTRKLRERYARKLGQPRRPWWG